MWLIRYIYRLGFRRWEMRTFLETEDGINTVQASLMVRVVQVESSVRGAECRSLAARAGESTWNASWIQIHAFGMYAA